MVGKDLKRWRAEPRGLWVIYTPKNRVRIDDYPAVRDWLLPFKDALERRATKQEWFELQQAQEAYSKFFEKPKISYRDIAAGSPFHLDLTGSYLETTGFCLKAEDHAAVALLNSRVLWFIFKNMTPLAQGGFSRMKAQYVELLPIPNIDPESHENLSAFSQQAHAAAVQRLVLQRGFVRRIPDLRPPGSEAKMTERLRKWWQLPDFAAFRAEVKKAFKADVPLAERSDWEDWLARDRAEVVRLTAEITAMEAQIDKLVYSLFELTSDEVSLLERVEPGVRHSEVEGENA